MPGIHRDITSDILLALPAKSLLRFRCLSRSLCSEIDNSEFVRMHLKRSMETKTRRRLFLITSMSDQGFIRDMYARDFDTGLEEIIRLDIMFGQLTFFCSSLDGLILLATGTETQGRYSVRELFLWNPTTRCCKKLPPRPFTTTPGKHCGSSIGLGYDSNANDYKVVMICNIYDWREHGVFCRAWIFSLRLNSWRYSQDVPLQIYPDKHVEFSNGALYWMCSGSKRMGIICGFDLEKEVFFKVPGSSSSDGGGVEEDLSYFDKCVFEGDLYEITKTTYPIRFLTAAFPEMHFQNDFYRLERDKSGGCNWKKAFAIEGRYAGVPLAFSKEGDCVLEKKSCRLWWYNLKNKTRRRVSTKMLPFFYDVESFVCWEGLVSLGNDTFQVNPA